MHFTREIENGQIVVAQVENEITVRRFQRHARRRRRVQLLPENPEFAPILVDVRDQNLASAGLSVGVLRTRLEATNRS